MNWKHIFPAAFNEAECEAIVTYCLSLPASRGTIGHGGKSVVDEDFRRSNIRWVPRDNPNPYWWLTRLEKLCLEANLYSFGFDLAGQCGGMYEIQFTEYSGAEQGGYKWHVDNNWKRQTQFDRKLSMVLQLSKSESYKGGRLELAEEPLADNELTNQGDVVFFPAFNRHQVTPVTEGTRYSLVTWFVGPKFR